MELERESLGERAPTNVVTVHQICSRIMMTRMIPWRARVTYTEEPYKTLKEGHGFLQT